MHQAVGVSQIQAGHLGQGVASQRAIWGPLAGTVGRGWEPQGGPKGKGTWASDHLPQREQNKPSPCSAGHMTHAGGLSLPGTGQSCWCNHTPIHMHTHHSPAGTDLACSHPSRLSPVPRPGLQCPEPGPWCPLCTRLLLPPSRAPSRIGKGVRTPQMLRGPQELVSQSICVPDTQTLLLLGRAGTSPGRKGSLLRWSWSVPRGVAARQGIIILTHPRPPRADGNGAGALHGGGRWDGTGVWDWALPWTCPLQGPCRRLWASRGGR